MREIYSGSYWPGDIYVIRETAKGVFAASEKLARSDGKPVNAGPAWESEQQPQMDSLASAPWLVDHDGDGDLDLYIGNIEGHVMLVVNEGDAKSPKFANSATALEADGKIIEVGGGDAGPSVADWDGDGRLDLLVGAGDGSVLFFRNTAKSGMAAYAAGCELVGKSAQDHEKPVPFDGKTTVTGSRSKVCVADWNGDGLKDLLLGDVYYQSRAPKPLNEAQLAKRVSLQEERQKLYKTYRETNPAAVEGAAREKLQAERDAILARVEKVSMELQELEDGVDTVGTVWVFLRKPPQR